MAASDVCQAHNGHVINQHGMSRPNSNRYSMAISGSRPKTDQPSVTPRDVTDFRDQDSLVSTERSKLLQRPLTARPVTRRSRTFVKDENGQNALVYHGNMLGSDIKNSHDPKQVPSVINGYYGYCPGYNIQEFKGIIRDDEDYYLDKDPIEYFYSPVFDLYPCGYLLANNSKLAKDGSDFSYTHTSKGGFKTKELFEERMSKDTINTDSSEQSTYKSVSDFTLRANPYPPKSRLPVPVSNPTFKKSTLKHDNSPTVQTIEYRRDLFEPKQKTTPKSSLANNSSSLSHDYQTEQTKAPSERTGTLSNSKISYLGAKRKQNDTLMKSDLPKSKFDVPSRDYNERKHIVSEGDLHNRPPKDDPSTRMKSREKCSSNRLAEYSQYSSNHIVSKKPSELNIVKTQMNGKQSVKYPGNREKSHKFNEKWTATGRVLDNRSLLTKQKLASISNQQTMFKPKPPGIPNQNKSRDQFAGRRPLSEDINNIMKDNSLAEDKEETSSGLVKGRHPYLRTGKVTLPKIRPQTERPVLVEQKPVKSPPRKLKPVLVKFDNMHF